MPADTPFTTPAVLMEPTAKLLLLQVPPVVVLLNAVVNPTHTFNVPAIAAGLGLTVRPIVVIQPAAEVYVIVSAPLARPDTMPEVEPMVASAGVLLVQVPPAVASVKVVVAPTHKVVEPAIAAGSGLTVTGVVTKQPVGNVKVIVTVPADTPFTTPVEEPMVARAVLLLLHMLVPDASASVVVFPTQTLVVPVIAKGSGLTVTFTEVVQPVARV